MSEHTAGPWIAGTDDQPESEIWIEADGPTVVAAVWGIEVEATNDTEAQANARLTGNPRSTPEHPRDR